MSRVRVAVLTISDAGARGARADASGDAIAAWAAARGDDLVERNMPARNIVDSDFTFLTERLAVHYGIKGVQGVALRKVALPSDSPRGGFMTQASVLKVTANGTTTSPVIRGKWITERIVGYDLPPPPASVPAVEPDIRGAVTIREQLAKHRQLASCASCHRKIDPAGFALENFDVIGGWRTIDESGKPVDASGATVSGAKVEGLAGLRALLLEQPEQFPRTVTEKLLSYALGRRLEYYDRPAVREIVRGAAAHEYRWSAIILGIVESPTFLMQAPHTETIAIR